jgi:hypothetical protein
MLRSVERRSRIPVVGCWTPTPRITHWATGLHFPASTVGLWAPSNLLMGLWSALRALGQCCTSARIGSIEHSMVCIRFLVSLLALLELGS